MKLKTYRRTGAFTLVEIMIVVAIIGLLAAIAIPNFVKAREAAQLNTCLANLRQIDGAKDQWAIENGKSTDDPANKGEVLTYLRGAEPKCPVGDAAYDFTEIGHLAKCTGGKKEAHNAAYAGTAGTGGTGGTGGGTGGTGGT